MKHSVLLLNEKIRTTNSMKPTKWNSRSKPLLTPWQCLELQAKSPQSPGPTNHREEEHNPAPVLPEELDRDIQNTHEKKGKKEKE